MKKQEPVKPKINPKLEGRIPACTLDKELLGKLWDILHSDGDFLWTADIGTGGDILGKQEERPTRKAASWDEMLEWMGMLIRIDSLRITAEIPGKGVIVILFKNYAQAYGFLVVNSENEENQEWVEDRYFDIMELFESKKAVIPNFLYTRLGFALIQTVIPLVLSCLLVVFVTAYAVPIDIRRTHWLWWITAATTIITLRIAYTVSDKLIIYAIQKYPYIRIS